MKIPYYHDPIGETYPATPLTLFHKTQKMTVIALIDSGAYVSVFDRHSFFPYFMICFNEKAKLLTLEKS